MPSENTMASFRNIDEQIDVASVAQIISRIPSNTISE